MSAPDPESLRALGKRLDEVQRERKGRAKQPPPTSAGVVFRISADLIVGLIVGGAIGWGLDWAVGHWSPFHTKPALMFVFLVLGAAAGIRNIIHTAKELNAVSAVTDDKRE